MKNEILNRIKEADMVLVGLGEEFEDARTLSKQPEYERQREQLSADKAWLIPALNHCTLCKTESKVSDSLKKLSRLLQDKNYFIVSIPTNDFVWNAGFDKIRVTAPCGGLLYRQCPDLCEKSLKPLNEAESEKLRRCASEGTWDKFDLGLCPDCGKPLVLNNIFANNYDEKGYLNQWERYTRWLQGTLNRKLLILELGVGMQFPTVVRWPFEKTVYYNQKSYMIRVHGHLYQLSQEIKERACSVPCNAIDWILSEDV